MPTTLLTNTNKKKYNQLSYLFFFILFKKKTNN